MPGRAHLLLYQRAHLAAGKSPRRHGLHGARSNASQAAVFELTPTKSTLGNAAALAFAAFSEASVAYFGKDLPPVVPCDNALSRWNHPATKLLFAADRPSRARYSGHATAFLQQMCRRISTLPRSDNPRRQKRRTVLKIVTPPRPAGEAPYFVDMVTRPHLLDKYSERDFH